jgi:hypothetical protein
MRFHRSLVGAALAVLIIVAVAASALAALPRKGAKYSGTLIKYAAGKFTGPIIWGKFHAPVSFTVSSSGTKLLSFKYGYTGCFGFGGVPTTTDIYTHYGDLHTVGTVAVAAKGSFKVTGAKSTHKASGGTGKNKFTTDLTTTSSLTGKFTTAKNATGTITFTQQDIYNGHKPTTCGPVSLTFSAKAG